MVLIFSHTKSKKESGRMTWSTEGIAGLTGEILITFNTIILRSNLTWTLSHYLYIPRDCGYDSLTIYISHETGNVKHLARSQCFFIYQLWNRIFLINGSNVLAGLFFLKHVSARLKCFCRCINRARQPGPWF